MVVPVPTPMNMSPSCAIVKPCFSIKIIGNASNTAIHFLQVRYQATKARRYDHLHPNSRPYTIDKYMVTMTKIGSSASIWSGRNIVRWMTAPIDQSCFSCSAYKSLFPTGSFLTSLSFFFNRMTGAYVSGRKMIMMVVHTPAKIIITQNTHLQETELSTMLKTELSCV